MRPRPAKLLDNKPRQPQTSGKVNEVMSIYRVTVKAEFDSTEDQFNVHHYEFPGYVPTAVELQEFVDNLALIYDDHIVQLCPALVSFNTIEVRRVDVGNLPTSELTPATWPNVGTGAGGSLPPQTCGMLRFTAPTAFPRSGRVYLQVFAQDLCSTLGQITAGALIQCDLAAADMEEIPITGQVDAQKVAVTYSGTPRIVTASNVLFAQSTSNVFQTQRRRTRGVGS